VAIDCAVMALTLTFVRSAWRAHRNDGAESDIKLVTPNVSSAVFFRFCAVGSPCSGLLFRRARAMNRNATRPLEVELKARIRITLKNGVLDPQGKAIAGALGALGFTGVEDVRQGKYIELTLRETDEAKARDSVERMCKDLLANTVIENYSYELLS
jgi:phosphoribosylformylglycinamidine synthase